MQETERERRGRGRRARNQFNSMLYETFAISADKDKATASPRPPTIRGTAAPVMLSSCGSANSRCEHSVHKTSRSLVHAIKMMSRTTSAGDDGTQQRRKWDAEADADGDEATGRTLHKVCARDRMCKRMRVGQQRDIYI